MIFCKFTLNFLNNTQTDKNGCNSNCRGMDSSFCFASLPMTWWGERFLPAVEMTGVSQKNGCVMRRLRRRITHLSLHELRGHSERNAVKWGICFVIYLIFLMVVSEWRAFREKEQVGNRQRSRRFPTSLPLKRSVIPTAGRNLKATIWIAHN